MSYDATRCASRQEELEWQQRTRYDDLIMAYNMPHYRPDDVGGTLPYPCPAIVRDKHNKVLLWSLPGILLPGRQVSRVIRGCALSSPPRSARCWRQPLALRTSSRRMRLDPRARGAFMTTSSCARRVTVRLAGPPSLVPPRSRRDVACVQAFLPKCMH